MGTGLLVVPEGSQPTRRGSAQAEGLMAQLEGGGGTEHFIPLPSVPSASWLGMCLERRGERVLWPVSRL